MVPSCSDYRPELYNLSGLKFGEQEMLQPIIQALSVDDGEATNIADTIKQQVIEGVAEANAEAGTDYKVWLQSGTW